MIVIEDGTISEHLVPFNEHVVLIERESADQLTLKLKWPTVHRDFVDYYYYYYYYYNLWWAGPELCTHCEPTTLHIIL